MRAQNVWVTPDTKNVIQHIKIHSFISGEVAKLMYSLFKKSCRSETQTAM
jgi:hypothetical protein